MSESRLTSSRGEPHLVVGAPPLRLRGDFRRPSCCLRGLDVLGRGGAVGAVWTKLGAAAMVERVGGARGCDGRVALLLWLLGDQRLVQNS